MPRTPGLDVGLGQESSASTWAGETVRSIVSVQFDLMVERRFWVNKTHCAHRSWNPSSFPLSFAFFSTPYRESTEPAPMVGATTAVIDGVGGATAGSLTSAHTHPPTGGWMHHRRAAPWWYLTVCMHRIYGDPSMRRLEHMMAAWLLPRPAKARVRLLPARRLGLLPARRWWRTTVVNADERWLSVAIQEDLSRNTDLGPRRCELLNPRVRVSVLIWILTETSPSSTSATPNYIHNSSQGSDTNIRFLGSLGAGSSGYELEMGIHVLSRAVAHHIGEGSHTVGPVVVREPEATPV
jgi:hypothetical protein